MARPKRTYNLCIFKKAKLEIGKGGGLGAWPQRPQNFKESKFPKGLSAMVSYVKKDLDMDLGKDQTYTSIWCWWW